LLRAAGIHEKSSLIVARLIVHEKWPGGVSSGAFGWDHYGDKAVVYRDSKLNQAIT